MVFGYLPVLVDFFPTVAALHKSNQRIPVNIALAPQQNMSIELICEKLLKNNTSFAEEFLRNRLSQDAFCVADHESNFNKVDGVPFHRKKLNVSPIKIISSGEFAGSKFVRGNIVSNFYADARKLGIPASVVDSVISNLSPKIDFRRSLKKGDAFEIIYDNKNVMLYSKIQTKYHQTAVYKFTQKNHSAYYFANGAKVVTRANSNSFIQPLRGKLHVSSGFGNRIHPVRGGYQRHTGVDLKASYGTPVFAIFDGVVARASPYYGYGNCIDIKHPFGYSSRYGHLSRYAVRYGSKVKRGQLIGYTGSTGISTGAHLHLELAKNSALLNPLNAKMISNEVQTVPNIGSFNLLKKHIEKIVAAK
jgi:murein DD-endopeptidase MepM/ murein hydrolase activator NlpD